MVQKTETSLGLSSPLPPPLPLVTVIHDRKQDLANTPADVEHHSHIWIRRRHQGSAFWQSGIRIRNDLRSIYQAWRQSDWLGIWTVMTGQPANHRAIPETKVSVFSPDVHSLTTG